jgi:hypothetical protein
VVFSSHVALQIGTSDDLGATLAQCGSIFKISQKPKTQTKESQIVHLLVPELWNYAMSRIGCSQRWPIAHIISFVCTGCRSGDGCFSLVVTKYRVRSRYPIHFRFLMVWKSKTQTTSHGSVSDDMAACQFRYAPPSRELRCHMHGAADLAYYRLFVQLLRSTQYGAPCCHTSQSA